MSFDFDELAAQLKPRSISAQESKGRRARGEAPLPRKARSKGEVREYDRTRKAHSRRVKLETQLQHIAVLDFETDPFDENEREEIFPFTACLWSDSFEPVVIWEEDREAFIDAVISAIEVLPGRYIIYAHNGGRFDYMFLIKRFRGRVSFKGRSLMLAEVGGHELRDSFHMIPEALGAYRKDAFDYDKMRKKNRAAHKAEIIKYMVHDCEYLFDIVKTFLSDYGVKLSIGQAAMSLLKKQCPGIKSLHANDDMYLRGYFYGGRVECLEGRGIWDGNFKLFDVNSMYPYVMSYFKHPVGAEYRPREGLPSINTVFVDVTCFSDGAFPIKTEGQGTLFPKAMGRYRISIHEFNVAIELGLIRDVKINYVVDCVERRDFADFILPLYAEREKWKIALKEFEAAGDFTSEAYLEAKKQALFLKLLMNNAYGKFAQNPRRFKEHFITDDDKAPDFETGTWGQFPSERCDGYAIWSRPLPVLRFNNVGTAASITGAARSVLMRAKAGAVDPIYCDTDSLICRELPGVDLNPTALGAWDIEAELSRVMIAGKKLYAYERTNGKRSVKCKGARGLTWENMETLVKGGDLMLTAKAPTLTRDGEQRYIDRRIRATVSERI